VGNRYGFDGQVALLPTVVAPLNFTATETRLGWTVGVGVEWAVLRYWSVKGEYDFLDFGRHTVTFTDPVFGGASVNVRQRGEIRYQLSLRAGACSHVLIGQGFPVAFSAGALSGRQTGQRASSTHRKRQKRAESCLPSCRLMLPNATSIAG